MSHAQENDSAAMSGPVLAVYGARRSGANYITNMLLLNTTHPVAILDAKPAQRIANNPNARLLLSAHGSKHDLSDRPPVEKYPADGVSIFVFRPIFSWVLSRVAYQRTHSALPAAAVPDYVRRVLQAEYLSMLTNLADHLEGALKDARIALVNYENLGLDTFEALLSRLGLVHKSPIEGIKAELKPGGGLSGRYVRKAAEQLVPETHLYAEIMALCAKALEASGPRIQALYERIFDARPVVLPDDQAAAALPPAVADQILANFWLGRFTVRPHGQSDVLLKDRLQPGGRVVPRALFAGLPQHSRDLMYFQHGFVRPVLGAVGAPVVEDSRGPEDMLAWQGPNRTEQAAMAAHAGLVGPLLADGVMHVYLGLPWATWIDRMSQSGHGNDDAVPAAIAQQLQLVGIQLLGYRHALAELGVQLRVHTVCQHLQWQQMLSAWRDLGVTDLWLSHCPDDSVQGFNLHAWRSWATQVEDPGRAEGLRLMADPETKPLLASFVGHLSEQAIADIRPRLAGLEADKRMHITLLPVAAAQAGAAAPAWPDAVAYNQVLSDSVFSLCPAVPGANMSGLWESLAVGAVPVLIGAPSSQPRLPEGGSLAAVDWSAIVLRVSADDLAGLPALLASMPMDEVRQRQKLGREAFEQVLLQRCF